LTISPYPTPIVGYGEMVNLMILKILSTILLISISLPLYSHTCNKEGSCCAQKSLTSKNHFIQKASCCCGTGQCTKAKSPIIIEKNINNLSFKNIIQPYFKINQRFVFIKSSFNGSQFNLKKSYHVIRPPDFKTICVFLL